MLECGLEPAAVWYAYRYAVAELFLYSLTVTATCFKALMLLLFYKAPPGCWLIPLFGSVRGLKIKAFKATALCAL